MASQPIRLSELVRFGDDFELDLRAYQLRRAGRALKLERIPMDLLVLLVQRRGELVTRDQIIEKIWGKDVFVDTDGGINSAIRKIRQVLRDDPDAPRFVETVSGRGYRFIAPVAEDAARDPQVTASPAVSPENLLGKKISHYRVLQMVGGGGMGVVYKAEDLNLGRLVALKFLPGEVGGDAMAFARLQQEARAASALDHANICSIYQLDEHEGRPFIVMQFLEGETLRDWIEAHAAQDAATRVRKAVEFGIQIAQGLEAAHEKGIIHRDIKPANIFITTRGQAKILDFGVAKFMEPDEAPENGKTEEKTTEPGDLQLTRTGAGVGTPSYLSPEQVRHGDVDTRGDLFSCGLVLYEMATARRAFSGNTAAAIRDAVSNQSVVPPRQVEPAVPPELERIIARTLEKNPDKRQQSAAELIAELQAVKAGLRPRGPWKSDARLWAAVGVAVVVLALFGLNAGGIRERLFPRPNTAATFKTRPSIAVLGFKNLSGRDDEAWISTALSETLSAELASGQELRVVPGENVARMKLDLSLPAADSYAQDTLGRIRNHLSADLVVHGSYLALGKDSGGKVRINLQLQETRAGETVAVVSQDGNESDLANLVTLSGASLREKLGIGGVSASDENRVRSSIPSNPEAAALYAEGLAKLRNYDAQSARDLLTRAVAADPRHALSYAALSNAWTQLGYDLKAQAEAKKALDLSAGLSREDQLSVEGRYRETTREWPRAVEVYRMLFEFFPDSLDYGLRLAHAQTSAGRGKEAMATVETLTKLPPPAADDPRIDLAEAAAADNLGDLRREETAAARAVKKGRRQGERTLTARALLTRGSVLSALGDNQNAVNYLREAQSVFADVGDQEGVARVLNNLGIIQRHQSNLVEARKLLEEELEISRRIGNRLITMKALTNLANVVWDQGDVTRSLDAHRQALAISREIGARNSESTSLNNIAGLLTLAGKLQEAQQMYNQSLQLYREVGDEDGAGLVLGNIADLLTRQGDLPAAREKAEEALATDRRVGDKSFEGYALSQLGNVLLSQGDVARARARLKEAAALRQQLGEKATEAESLLSLAQLELEAGNLTAAETEARRLAALFHGSGAADDDEAMSHSVLAIALLAQGKTAEAERAAAVSNQVLRKALDISTRLQVEIASAYVSGMAAPSTTAGDALKALESTRGRAGKLGYVGLEMEARLRLGEIELRSGKKAAGRARLEQLHKDAQAKGFLLVVRKAKAALAAG